MIYLNGKEITSSHFPNGELNILKIQEAMNLKRGNEPHHFVLKYVNDSDLMALYFAKKHIDRVTLDVSTLSISYMPYSRMDRAETPTTPFMLDSMCDFINELNFSKVYVHEAHSQVTIDKLNNVHAVYDNIFLIEEVMNIEGFRYCEGDYLVFPDKGAYERYNGRIENERILICEKKRDFNTGQILGLEINTEGMKHGEAPTAFIVDDLSSYGGTFVRVAKKLREIGFKRVILLVCHAENSIFYGDLFESVDKVYTTDSILTEQNNWENKLLITQNRLHVFNMIDDLRNGVTR